MIQSCPLFLVLSSELGNVGGTSDKTGENPTPLQLQDPSMVRQPQ